MNQDWRTQRDEGSDPVCVLLPGMLCSHELWRAQRAGLDSIAQLPVVQLTASSIDRMVDQVLAVPHPRFALAGLSLGGIVAMAVTLTAPERVSGLALLSTSARAPRPDQRDAWQDMAARTRRGDFARITPETLVPMMVHPDRRHEPGIIDRIVGMADAVGPDTFLSQLTAQQSRIDLRPTLPAIRCPTLVVAGADDYLAPPSAHQEIAASIPGARLDVLPRTGHLSPLEQPDAVTDLLRGWLSSTTEHPEPNDL